MSAFMYFIYFVAFVGGALLGFIYIGLSLYKAIREWLEPSLKDNYEWNHSILNTILSNL